MECINPRYLVQHDIQVPCGRCGFCLATRKSDWATRLEYEARLWLDKRFITLTYADPHLYWIGGKPQLKKDHLQNYFKRLRKAGYKLRYYAVGEYGAKYYRPHYHIILFGSIPEKLLREKWDKGLVHIGTVTQQSIAYCLKYVVNSKGRGMRNGRLAPFSLMSRKPGLGANYLSTQMKEWHKSGRKNYVIIDGQKRHLPRYYKEKIFSKIDRVRIAVRDQKEAFERLRKRLKNTSMKIKNPYLYYQDQLRQAEKRVRDKHQQNLTI